MVMHKNLEEDNNFFAKEIARKVCSEHDQNAVILCTGAMGSGKSWTMLELARLISIYISEKIGGNPEDYFNLDNVAIMTAEDIERVYELMDSNRHCVYIIDDAGATINARRFQSDENVAQNDRLQIMRPNSNVVIYTTPNKRLIDVAVRFLSGYQIYMRDPAFQLGMTCADIRRISVQDDGSIHYPFLQNHRGEKYKLHLFRAPPKEWTDVYRERRKKATEEMTRQARETLESKINKKISVETKKDKSLRLHSEWKKGEYGEVSFKELCKMNQLSYQYANNVVSENTN